jgi:hypothetical protein
MKEILKTTYSIKLMGVLGFSWRADEAAYFPLASWFHLLTRWLWAADE